MGSDREAGLQGRGGDDGAMGHGARGGCQEIGRRWRKDFRRDGLFIPYGGDTVAPTAVQPGLRHRGYVLVVARFVPENTIPEFFDAVDRIAGRHAVVIVGSSGYGGEFDERAEALAMRHPNVLAYGHVRDDAVLLSLWQHAGAYFHGHSVGGTNPALVQAMAAGAPVVARDTAYTREVLLDNAVFVGPDAEEIAGALDALLSNPELQDRLSDGGRQRAEQAYGWQQVCADYEAALRSLAGAWAKPERVSAGVEGTVRV
jgi:glycosyltransferase involved in cell wall biosynthesis